MCVTPVVYTTVEQLLFVSVSLHIASLQIFHSWMEFFVGFFFLLILAKIKLN